jgi:hypothetical protein
MVLGFKILRRTAALISLGLAVFFATPSLADTERSTEFESTCSTNCIGKDKGAEYCAAYCTCMTREVFLGRPDDEVDKLYSAMEPHAPDSSEKAILKLLVGQCVREAKAQ